MHCVVYVLFLCFILSLNVIFCQRFDVHDSLQNVSHVHAKSYSVGVMPEEKPPYAIVFIFGAPALAVLIRQLWVQVHFRLPYAIVMFSTGALIGWFASIFEEVHDYTKSICEMSPKYLIIIFIPALVFRTAFCIDAYAFKRNIRQILLVSVLGFLIAVFLIAALTKGLYLGHWSWELALMFAAISCTSYPQDVVILLREQGQSKQLCILLEGEGLLIDGMAIVLFNIMLGYITGYVTDALHIFILCILFIGGGPILGFIIGKITAFTLSRIYNDIVSSAIVTLVVAYFSYYIAEEVFGLSGILCIVVLGIVISTERISLSSEVDKFLQLFWEIISFFAFSVIFMMVGVLIFEVISGIISVQDLINAIILYFICFFSRLIVYLIMCGIFNISRNPLSPKFLAILVFGHLRGAVCLCLALVVERSEGLEKEGPKFLIYISTLVLLSQIINGCLLPYLMKALGMADVSVAKRANMNSAIRYLMIIRERSLNMVKMDRHLSGANWMLVHTATLIKHPYKALSEKGEEKMSDLFGYRIAVCPDCLKEVLTEPTKAEYEEMLKEANLRILKAKKVSYRRQYEHGMLSKEAIHILITAVELASDRENPVIDIDDLKGMWTRNKIASYMRKHLVAIVVHIDTNEQPPKQRVPLNCYKIVTSLWFDYFMLYIIIINAVVIIVEVIYNPVPDTSIYLAIMILNHIFCALFITELVMKLTGLGFKNYFKSYINILDLIVLCVSLLDLMLHYHEIYNKYVQTSYAASIWETIARCFPLLRLIRIFRIFKGLIPKMIVFLDGKFDAQLRRSYDVGKGFVIGEEEILKMLVHIVDNKSICEKIKEKIEDDRLAISKKLGLIQKEYPEVAVSVKTRQAIRTVLNKIRDAVKELNDGGLLDDFEFTKCILIVDQNMNFLRTHYQKVESCPPHILLQEVPWIAGDGLLEAFLSENTRPVNFNHGEVIIAHGAIPESLYIILFGVVKDTYVPSDKTLKNLKSYGALPNVDYFTTLHFEDRQEEFILPGNVIGELGVLTGRPYDATASCETSVQAYEIPLSSLLEAMNDFPDPSTGLKARMWKAVALRVAQVILTNTPHYQTWTQEDIKYHLERAFVPTLSQSSIFTVTELIEDVLLIEGQVMDADSKTIYYAPCYIPRTLHKLIFPENSSMNVNTNIITKLLIIPVKYCDEVEVIEDGQGLRITSSFSARCLQHSVQHSASKSILSHRNTSVLSHRGKGYGRHWNPPGTRSVHFLQSSRPSIIPTDYKSMDYQVYSASIVLSDNSERLEKVIDSSSWTTILSQNTLSYPLLSKKSETKSYQVNFEDEQKPYRKSNTSFVQDSEMDQLNQAGSNGLPVHFSEENTEIQDTRSNSLVSDSSTGKKENDTTEEELVLPFKRVFLPDIIEKEEDSNHKYFK